MQVTVHKMHGNDTLRTGSITGKMKGRPVVGQRIEVFGKPINSAADGRLFSSSPVVKITGNYYTTHSGTIYLLVEQS